MIIIMMTFGLGPVMFTDQRCTLTIFDLDQFYSYGLTSCYYLSVYYLLLFIYLFIFLFIQFYQLNRNDSTIISKRPTCL